MKIHRIAAFTDNGSGGNPAGVVLTDQPLDAATMQRIAAEVGYSETAFAAPMGDTWRTRYFSPENEVPFCGHATIALGAALAVERGAGRYRLALAGGEIAVDAAVEGGTGRATLWSLPTRSKAAPAALVDAALALFGYRADDLDPALPPHLMHAGAEHLFLALKRRDDLAAMRYDLAQGRALMQHHGLVTVALVWHAADRLFHARNAFASGGVVEDPATGAAAAAMAGMLRDQGLLLPGRLIILQGADMGRPSRITVDFEAPDGSPVRVSGASAKLP
jgi:PhzF family phenazine biosynthesis protein